MIFLQHVADYVRTGRAIKALSALLRRRKPIISFDAERDNRPPRYVEVIDAYKAGTPIDQIAFKYGCAKGTVHRYARMAGLYRPKESSVRDAILALYQQGKPIAEISARLGVSQALVSKYANEAGIGRNPHRKTG
jgi:DNA-binding NarL/FixJ family response regulator